ncbi:serine/threonine-protein kinase MARK2 isoform X3 [Nematostella vectensis]|uniref:serine/threonine-protein kinase MARK2 isoform X3 n=1 Tax=Nematostella vectensis TaxID=45351 RepID=UPI0020775274|nr:serine/threonine-protein kinase MARK2 isoform X3 [Nematostella vectensis]
MRHDVTSVMSSNRQGRERRKSPAREPSPVTNAGCLPPSVVHVSREELKRFLKCKRVGNYLLGKTIGEGSFAKVKQGFHVLTGEKVAVKIIDKKQALEDRYVSKNMRREARILQMVRHPHIISLLEVVETENRYYLVFELAGGGDLMDYICYRKRLGETEVRKFIRQIISAVQYLHQGGIIHRDLKVENLLLDEEYNIRIIDFGLSNTVSVAKPGDLSPIKDYCKTQCGSPAYAAPEILGHQLYGTKVDVWSIGVNMYAMLTGKLPYTAEPFNIVTLYNKMVRGEMNAVPDRLSPSCRDLLMRFLTFDPDERISLDEAINHVWLKKGYEDDELTPVVFPNHLRLIYLNMDILNHMVEKMNFTEKDIIDGVTNNKSNSASCVYHLLSKKLRMYLLRHPPKNSVRSSRRDRARLRDEPDASTKKLRIEETLGPPSDERLAKVSQAESTDSTDDDARRKRLSCNQDGPLLRDSNVNREDSRDQLSVPMCSQVQRSEAFENGGNCEDPEDREEDRPYSRRDAVVFDISEPCNERKISYAAYTQEQGNDEKFEETEITVPVILTDDTREPYIANGEQDKENEANASRRASLPSRGRTRSNPSVTTETSTLSKQKRPSLPCRAYPVTREPSPIRKPIQPSEHAQTVPRRKNSAGNTYGLVCQISAVEPEAAPTTKSEVNNGPAKLVLKSNRSPISVHCSPKPSRRHSTPVNPSQEFYKAIMGKVSPTNENRDNFDGRQNLKSFSTSLRRRGSTSSNSSDDSKKTSPRRNRYSLPITPREPLLPNLALKLHTKQPPLEPLTLPPAPMLAHRLDGTSLEDYNRSPRRSRDLHQVRRSTIDNVSRKAIEGVLHEPSKQPEKATRESQDKARQRRKTISLDTRKSRDEESRGHVTEIHVEVKASPRSGRKSLESGDVSLDAQAQKSTGLPRFMEVKYSVTDKDKRHRVPVEMSSLVKKGEEIEDELKTDSQANEHFDDADYNREGLGERDALMARKSEVSQNGVDERECLYASPNVPPRMTSSKYTVLKSPRVSRKATR